MNVLSLFDGISCARVAVDRAGIPVKNYYASEIDKHAIAISTKNYPNIVRVGDVKQVKGSDFSNIDLLVGGSPCVDLSIAKRDRKGLDGEHSSLFWEYVRILREVKPTWFVLENVASMPKKDRDIITAEMGVEPVMVDASLVSAQSRRRYFWTNIPFTLPADRNILLKDILETNVEGYSVNSSYPFIETGRAGRLLGHLGKEHQGNRVYSIEGKSATLSANGGGMGAKTGLYWVSSPYPIHIPIGESTENIRTGHEMRRKLKNGKRADDDPSIPFVRRIETRNDDKCGTLTTVLKDNHVVDVSQSCIRKLTPTECERLQGLPDGYTEGVAKTQRYKCLGNAFNVDVVAHIFLALHNEAL